MILNLAISTSIGLVPGIGDILLAAYRANVRNARLLEKFLLLRGERAAAKAVQQTTADQEKHPGGAGVGEVSEGSNGVEVAAASLPGAASGEAEKSPTVVPGSEDGGDDKDQIRVLPRPPRHTLEVVQRDSRFIEDVS